MNQYMFSLISGGLIGFFIAGGIHNNQMIIGMVIVGIIYVYWQIELQDNNRFPNRLVNE